MAVDSALHRGKDIAVLNLFKNLRRPPEAKASRTAQLIQELAKHKLVIVVEHDMEFIRQLDAPVTMFHQGAVLTSGTIAELRADERVLDAYLGRGAASHAQPK